MAVATTEASFDVTFGSGPNPGVVQVVTDTGASVGRAIGALADGSLIVATDGQVRRYLSNGQVDSSFGPPATSGRVDIGNIDPVAVDVQANGMIIVTGSRTDTGLGDSADPVVVRMSAAGIVDSGFVGTIAPNRFRVSAPFEVDSKIAMTTFDPFQGQACIHRLNATDGTLDGTFGTSGHACVDGLVSPHAAYAFHRLDGGYTLYVPVQTPGAADVSGSEIHIFEFAANGSPGSTRLIPAVPGEFLQWGLVAPDGSLIVAGERHGFIDGFVRRYHNDSLDPSFAASGDQPGVASLPALRIERLVRLADGRLLAVGSLSGFTFGQARLLSADGRPDGALQPDAGAPDRITLPRGVYTGWSPNNASFADAVETNGRVALVGTESDVSGFTTFHKSAVVVRSVPIDPSRPLDGKASFGSYVPVVPERLLDTRPDALVGYSGPKPVAGDTVRVQVTGVGATNVPADAKAVVLNVTGTDATADGFVTVWPCGEERPLSSNLNLLAGMTRPNSVISAIGAGGGVCLYTQRGTHLIVDVNGYFASASTYVSAVPQRVLDTRPDTQLGYSGSKPAAGSIVRVQVAGPGMRTPAGTSAVVLNLTGTNVDAGTYVMAFPCGTPLPFQRVSNLNAFPGDTIANLVVAPVGADGAVCLYVLNPLDLIADVSGWFPSGSVFVPGVGNRVLDTRPTAQIGYVGPTPGAGSTVEVAALTPSPTTPSDATAVVLDIVGTDARVPGYVTVWPCGSPRPLASNLNLAPGGTIATLVISALGPGGKVCLFTQNGAELIADVFGYIVPR